MAAIFPLLTIGGLYTQHVANAQVFAEFSHVVNYAWKEGRDGKAVFVVNDGEPAGNIYHFLATYCEVLYGLPTTPHVRLVQRLSDVSEPSIIVTSLPPGDVFTRGLGSGVEPQRALAFARTEGAGLRRLADALTRLSSALGNRSRPRYDRGSAVIDRRGRWYIYTAERGKAPGQAEMIGPVGLDRRLSFEGRGSTPDISVREGSSATVSLHRGEAIYLPVKNVEGYKAFVLPANIRVARGRVSFGVSKVGGRDIWNYALSVDSVGELPAIPVLYFDPSQTYRVFFHAIEDVEFELSDVRSLRAYSVDVWRTFDRFGSLPL